jgi:uncharacterized protein (TIGR00106 family)
MKVTAMFSVIPISSGTSLSRYVAACEQVFRDRGLEAKLHAHGTNVEGEWDEVMGALRAALEKVHSMGVTRISTFVKLGTRTDQEPSMDRMVRSVKDKLGDPVGGNEG